MNRTVFAAIGLAAVMATPALADSPCLRLDQIWNWKVVDDKTLIVENLSHQKFKVSLMGTCYDLAYKNNLGFKSIGGTGLSCLSGGDEVFARGIAIPNRCPIASVVLYTPEMEKADKAAAAAKAQQQNAH
ncbi:MAG: DUF6491 family protein [Rhizomicrobium sp.]